MSIVMIGVCVRARANNSAVFCSSAEFQRQRITLIRFIALFFFCLQSSAFWHFRWQKMTSFNDSENKKKLTGSHLGLAGWTGFSRANSRTSFCLNPDRSQARVGRVSNQSVGPIRVLKLLQKNYSTILN